MTNRRSFIKGTSAAVIALSAGCLDMNGDDENVNDDETDDTGQNSSTTQSSGGDNVTIESVVSNVRCIEEDSSNPLADITSQSDDGLYEFSGRFVVPRQNYEAVIDAEMNGTVLEVKVSAEQTGKLSEDDCVSYLMYGGQISVDENQTVTETTIENI